MEVKKFKSGQVLNASAKLIVINIFYFLSNESKENNGYRSVSSTIDRVSEMTGVSVRTIYKIKEESEKGEIKSPSKTKRRLSQNNSRENKYDEDVRSNLRNIVHTNFFAKNIPPTVRKIYAFITAYELIPNFSMSTLYRLLKDIGFSFQKRGRNSIMLERSDIVHWRHKYLRKIRQFRNEGSNIIYLDESWVNVGNSVNKEWVDTTIKNSRDAFIRGLTTDLRAPSKRGPRFVLLHAGCEDGFIEGAQRIFLAKKNDGDYHEEMDGDYFEEWFEHSLIPNLPQNGRRNVIVMDNAPYHSVKKSFPRTSWKKADIQQWLIEKDIYFQEDYLKTELLEVANSYKDTYDRFKIEDIADRHNVTVLRLPPYHCELNPIEMVWSQVKR